MRKIKFRAWHKIFVDPNNDDNKKAAERKWEMAYYAIEDAGSWVRHDQEIDKDGFDYPCYNMQFTGVKDKNGKEIYENDIFQAEEENKDSSAIVIFDEKNLKFCLDRTVKTSDECNYGGHELYLLHSKGIVIGNIYENPNLLK